VVVVVETLQALVRHLQAVVQEEQMVRHQEMVQQILEEEEEETDVLWPRLPAGLVGLVL
jgi:hypothetical protein